jgi:hypothetical protein
MRALCAQRLCAWARSGWDCEGVREAHVAQLVEHVLGKDEVSGSIPLVGSSLRDERREQAKADVLGALGGYGWAGQ